jgi:Lsr2
MAQRMQVMYTDDLDGSEADSTIRFSYAGTDYEIDLTAKNADNLTEALAPFTGAARKIPARRPGRGTRPVPRHDPRPVRGRPLIPPATACAAQILPSPQAGLVIRRSAVVAGVRGGHSA